MKKTRIVAAVFVLCVLLVTKTPVALADGWSWASGEQIISSQIIDGYSDPHQVCNASSETMTISGQPSPEVVCSLEKTSTIEVGTYAMGQSAVVRFGQDDTAYPLFNCKPTDCLYDSAQDSVITKQHVVNQNISSLVIYQHASQRLEKTSSGATVGYSFDLNNADYVDWDSSGYAWPIGAFALSANGRWLAMEYYNNGFGVMDMATLTMTKVGPTFFSYGQGLNPSLTLAIANDGQTVAITGSNAADFLIEVRPGCGFDPLHDVGSPSCVLSSPDVDLRNLQNGYNYTTQPSFNDDASQLTVASLYWPSVVRVTTIRVMQAPMESLDYLGIGDSYTSGEGETDDNRYIVGTNEPFEKCHTSNRSYPYLVATLSNSQDVHSVACSGARMNDVEASLDGYLGQSDRLGPQGLALSPDQVSSHQLAALSQFLPGEIPQAYFVDRYQPRVLMVGIGGNDAGFMDKMRACMMPDECEWVSESGKAQSRQEIGSLQPKLASLYRDLQRRSPSSRIYAIGYPQIINPDGECDALTSFMFDHTERQFIRESLDYIDQVIAAAASDAGISYVDVAGAYGEHVACGDSDQLAVNELQLGDDVAPISALAGVKLFGDETFHPTPLGHELVAAAIHDQFPDLVHGNTLCASEACTVTPHAPADWSDSPVAQAVAQQVISTPQVNLQGPGLVITLATNELQPGSIARIEIHSDPVELASVAANSDGSLTQNVSLPKDLSAGYHTLHVIGTSYVGQPIDYYQAILVDDGSSLSLPVKANGVPTNRPLHTNDNLSVPSEVLNVLTGGSVKGATIVASHPTAASVSTPVPRHWWKLVVAVAFIIAVIMLIGLAVRATRDG